MTARHNPRTCRMCGTLRNGPVRLGLRKGLTRQTRTNGENTGGGQ